jgi:hypothetical protein
MYVAQLAAHQRKSKSISIRNEMQNQQDPRKSAGKC